MSLDNSDKPVEQYEHPEIMSQFESAFLSGYLSPPTRVSHCRVTVLARVPHACIILETQFSI